MSANIDYSLLDFYVDRFYIQHGKCCSGCDWWSPANPAVGECTRSAPMDGCQRLSMIGMTSVSKPVGAGHVVTYRDHVCGEFKDDFDWSKLPAAYLKRIGKVLP